MRRAILTDEQEQHLARIKACFKEAVDQKYRAGCLEHKTYLGDLAALELVEHAMAENLDQYCYLHALREKLRLEIANG